jgi:DNA-damage-inducible protein D
MDHGYQGLYGGLGMRDIHRRKGLKQKQHILDHMGSTELAANLFRTTQAEDKLRRENVRSKDRAGQIHKEVGRKVRQTIRELGGTMPENLPTAAHSLSRSKRIRIYSERATSEQISNAPPNLYSSRNHPCTLRSFDLP